MVSRDYFKGKMVAVIGLGPHGEMVEDVKFLIKSGALVSIYDMRSEARIKDSLVFLRTLGLANYFCGPIPADDLLDMDLILLSHEYPRESSFLKKVYERNDEKEVVEYPESLFFKLAPPVTVIGVMGDCGKSTVISMLTPMLEFVCKKEENQGFFVLDPESDEGILAHLKKLKSGDLVLLRITDLAMRELCNIRISPHVAVFTTVPSRGFSNSPFEILAHQTYNNFVIASDEVIDVSRNFKELPRAKLLRTKPGIIPADWGLGALPAGQTPHNRENAALALQTARLFKVDDELARRALSQWKPLKGHMEFVKKVKNIEFYNDSASSGPLSTLAALQTISNDKNSILIFGGAINSHGGNSHDYRTLYSALPQYVHSVVLLPGSGTMRERAAIHKFDGIEVHSVPSVEESVRVAMEHAKKGEKIIFSPGFEAAGVDASRKERGERFVRAVRGL
jgi:UDP-N-acetylmuramoylalanine--D-glutamate ligase